MSIFPPLMVKWLQQLSPSLYRLYCSYFRWRRECLPFTPIVLITSSELPIESANWSSCSETEVDAAKLCSVRAVQHYKDPPHDAEYILATIDMQNRASAQLRIDRCLDTPIGRGYPLIPDSDHDSTPTHVCVSTSGPLPPQCGLGRPHHRICPTATSSDLVETWTFTRPVPFLEFLRIATTVSNETAVPISWAIMGASKDLWEGASSPGPGPAKKSPRKFLGAVGSAFDPDSEVGQQRIRDVVAVCPLGCLLYRTGRRKETGEWRGGGALVRGWITLPCGRINSLCGGMNTMQSAERQEPMARLIERHEWLKERHKWLKKRARSWLLAEWEKQCAQWDELTEQLEELEAVREKLCVDTDELNADTKEVGAEHDELKAAMREWHLRRAMRSSRR